MSSSVAASKDEATATAASPSATLAEQLLNSYAASSSNSRTTSSPSVHVKDRQRVLQKLSALVKGGASQLHVITDFDSTISRYWHEKDGVRQRSVTTHGILHTSLHAADVKDHLDGLYKKYYPYEIHPHMSEAEKTPYMLEWWEQVHDTISKTGITPSDIASIVRANPVTWRPGVHAFAAACHQHAIPVLVFSAGVADIIEECLRQEGLFTPETHVISNKMMFEDAPPHRCVRFSEPIIHVFNKNESAIQNTTYFDDVSHRPNVIVMGDSMGDLKMSHGLKHDVQLSVGFLNHDEEQLMDKYMEGWDVVIAGDGPFDLVNDLLAKVVAAGR